MAAIPVGLTFDARKSFGGRVRVAFGEPLPLRPFLDLHGQDQKGRRGPPDGFSRVLSRDEDTIEL